MMGTTEILLASLCLVGVGVVVAVLILLIRRTRPSSSSTGPDPFRRAEIEYQRLHTEFEAGSLTEDGFKERLKNIMVQDKTGSWWTLGHETGQWYYHNGTTWIAAEPPSSPAAPSDSNVRLTAAGSPTQTRRILIFAGGLLALLAVPGICSSMTYGLITSIGGDYDLAAILSVLVASLIFVIGIVLLVISVRRINRTG